MVIPEFKIAFEKAAAVTKYLSYRSKGDSFVSLDEIIAAVKHISGFAEINVLRQSFSQLELPDEVKNSTVRTYGAMLSTLSRVNPATNEKEKVAQLVINSDYNVDMQRFSVVHELGHLITDIPNFTYEQIDDGKFTISAHVNPDITYISEEFCVKNSYFTAEQVANIFALLVLIPRNIRIRDIREEGIDKLKSLFGVTEDAIYSRMLLSNVRVPE